MRKWLNGVFGGGGDFARSGMGRRQERPGEQGMSDQRGLLLLHQVLPEVASRAGEWIRANARRSSKS
jgi:hypothetical protein